MKIIYLANIRLPTDKAHGLQIMKTCEAFALAGHEIELLVPNRTNDIPESPFLYYGVEPIFTVTKVQGANLLFFGPPGYLLQNLLFSLVAAKKVRKSNADVIYGRDESVLYIISLFIHIKLVWESHTGSWNFFVKRLLKSAASLVVITNGLKNFYITKGVPTGAVTVAPDGIDLKDFANPEPKEGAKKRLGLPLDKKIAMYIGRLDGWKGTDTLFKASVYLPSNVQTVVIGGEPLEVAKAKDSYPGITFLGYRPYKEIADNQSASDVLILPNTATNKISTDFTSPLKLFTYMASNRPTVASDLPSIREVLDETTAVLVEPDSPEALDRK